MRDVFSLATVKKKDEHLNAKTRFRFRFAWCKYLFYDFKRLKFIKHSNQCVIMMNSKLVSLPNDCFFFCFYLENNIRGRKAWFLFGYRNHSFFFTSLRIDSVTLWVFAPLWRRRSSNAAHRSLLFGGSTELLCYFFPSLCLYNCCENACHDLKNVCSRISSNRPIQTGSKRSSNHRQPNMTKPYAFDTHRHGPNSLS